jgi:hypothetical protein
MKAIVVSFGLTVRVVATPWVAHRGGKAPPSQREAAIGVTWDS